MDAATRRRLADLNAAFYREHGARFSATRRGPWPGFRRVLAAVPDRRPLRVLDVGCGNGRFAATLLERLGAGQLRYLGIDASEPMLAAASRLGECEGVRFEHRDLLAGATADALPTGPFDLVALFGVLHHVPGEAARRALLEACAARLAPAGLLALTFWRYDRDPRFASRRLDPRSLVPPLDPAALEPGDHLLGFADAPGAARYCHFADDAEQDRLLRALPAQVEARFDADGAGDALNHYALLRAAPPN